MHVTLELARRVDRAEIDFCALAITTCSSNAATLERGGGRAVYGCPGSPVNKVLGLGLGAAVTDDDLDAIEDFYEERDCPIQIELCPLASPDLPPRLTTRGYVLQAFETELAREAPTRRMEPLCGADITVEAAESEQAWLEIVAHGFAAPDRIPPGAKPVPADAVSAIREVMRQFSHPAVVRYVACAGGEPAAGGLSFISGGVLGIFGTATLPAFRRRGLQSAIVARAMNDALGRADLVIATTEPGSTSQRTFERLGFQVIYTRAILVKS